MGYAIICNLYSILQSHSTKCDRKVKAASLHNAHNSSSKYSYRMMENNGRQIVIFWFCQRCGGVSSSAPKNCYRIINIIRQFRFDRKLPNMNLPSDRCFNAIFLKLSIMHTLNSCFMFASPIPFTTGLCYSTIFSSIFDFISILFAAECTSIKATQSFLYFLLLS